MKNPLRNLSIRTAVVQRRGLGYIQAGDLKREAAEDPHSISFVWEDGVFDQSECNYDSHSMCIINRPQFAIVDLSESGYYSVDTEEGVFSGDIIEDSSPPPTARRFGGLRSVSCISEQAYAVGLRGMVYRLEEPDLWRRIDDGLPQGFDVEAIHGFDDSEIYAVGNDGQLWLYNGEAWKELALPLSSDLNTVHCAENGKVYIAGNGGILISGREETWELFDQQAAKDDIWDLEWFENKLYISTMDAVYFLKNDKLELVDFGDDKPESCNQLSSAGDVLWSVGESDIMSLSENKWKRIV